MFLKCIVVFNFFKSIFIRVIIIVVGHTLLLRSNTTVIIAQPFDGRCSYKTSGFSIYIFTIRSIALCCVSVIGGIRVRFHDQEGKCFSENINFSKTKEVIKNVTKRAFKIKIEYKKVPPKKKKN